MEFVIAIINCKADKSDDKWKLHSKTYRKQLRLTDIKTCSPVTQLMNVFKQRRDQNQGGLVQDLKKVSNAYYCLLHYAINLCGDADLSIYKLIKMYTGYYVNNLSSVMEDEAYLCLTEMGYFYKDEYQDELVLSLNEENEEKVYVSDHIKDLVKNLFFAYLYCEYVAELITHTFHVFPKADFEVAKAMVRKVIESKNHCLGNFDAKFVEQFIEEFRYMEIQKQEKLKQMQIIYQQQIKIEEETRRLKEMETGHLQRRLEMEKQEEEQQRSDLGEQQRRLEMEKQEEEQQRSERNDVESMEIEDDDLYGESNEANKSQQNQPTAAPRAAPRQDIFVPKPAALKTTTEMPSIYSSLTTTRQTSQEFDNDDVV